MKASREDRHSLRRGLGSSTWAWLNRLSLRQKTLQMGVSRLVVLMIVLGVGLHLLIQQGFRQVEDQSVRENVARMEQALLQATATLERGVHDYAVWDDSYDFVLAPKPKYIEDNLSQDMLANLHLTQALILDRELRLVAGSRFKPGTQEFGSIEPGFVRFVAPLAGQLLGQEAISLSGLVQIGDEVYLAGACKILPTHESAPPAGVFVFMKPLDRQLLKEFSQLLQVELTLSQDPRGSAEASPPDAPGAPGYLVLTRTTHRIHLGLPLHDFRGRPIGRLEATLPRTIQQRAILFIALVYLALAVVLVAMTLLWPRTMGWLVLDRLEEIHRFVTLLGEKISLQERLPNREGDELDALAIGINRAVDRLEEARRRQEEAQQETLRLEEQLVQIQKVEAIGTMAGGVAHDFNNSLGAIMGSIELAQEELPPDHPVQKHLARMKKAGAGACSLARQMLNLSRSETAQKTPIRLGETVADVLRLVRAGLPRTLEVRFQNEAIDDVVMADPNQLQQVIMNLATNASHAMANQPSGCIEVTIREVLLPAPDRRPETLPLAAGSYLRLDFADNGQGIPQEIRTKVFDPFFTTKPVGSGTGLGLAVAQGFVARHSGSLGLESEVGKGATFIIHLPKYHGSPLAPEGGTGDLRVLLVDDDLHGRETLAEGLRKCGHEVTEVSSGGPALRLVEERREAFDVVVTDQIMPGMTGLDLAERLQEAAPGLPVFLISGYTGPLDPQALRAKGILGLYMKPVAVAELHQAIQATKPTVAGSAGS